jgi:hypothetical protein
MQQTYMDLEKVNNRRCGDGHGSALASTHVVCLLRITTSRSVRPVVPSESLTPYVIPTLQASVTLSQPHTSLVFQSHSISSHK